MFQVEGTPVQRYRGEREYDLLEEEEAAPRLDLVFEVGSAEKGGRRGPRPRAARGVDGAAGGHPGSPSGGSAAARLRGDDTECFRTQTVLIRVCQRC